MTSKVELQEPKVCCVGVRKITFFFSLLQALLLFFSLCVYVIGVLRATQASAGYYVAESDTLLAVSMRDGVYTEVLEVNIHPVNDLSERETAALKLQPQPVANAPSYSENAVAPSEAKELAEEPYRNVQLRIVEDYDEASITTCRGRRDALIVLGTVGMAFCLTILVLIGVWHAKPTYLLPYCYMLLCDLVLTAGVLLTACFYIRNAREWIALERNVEMVFKEHLLRLSDGQLHAVLVLIGSGLFTVKIMWFLIVCRCYSFIAELSNRRLMNKFGLIETAPFAPGHHRTGSAGVVRIASHVDPILKHSRNLSDFQLPSSVMLPPSYEETQRTAQEIDKLLQSKQE